MAIISEKPWVKFIPETDTYGRFVVEPLDRGYGTTLGNALRRVLLSSLPGAAVTSIKIGGISHEFSTIGGVAEDTLGIILNIKELVIKSYSESPKTIHLHAKGKGEVKAEKLEHDAEIEIVNPDLHLVTLDGGKLDIEMVVERGKGYRSAEENKKGNLPVDAIPIDSIFTPLKKVNLTIEDVRVGQEIKYDRLILDVWTNGAIRPDDAVKESAQILSRHVEMFVNLGERVEVLGGAPRRGPEEKQSLEEMSVEDLELSARSSNCLRKAGIKTVGELLRLTETDLMNIKNFGSKSADEVKEKLAEYGLFLKGEVSEPPAGEVVAGGDFTLPEEEADKKEKK